MTRRDRPPNPSRQLPGHRKAAPPVTCELLSLLQFGVPRADRGRRAADLLERVGLGNGVTAATVDTGRTVDFAVSGVSSTAQFAGEWSDLRKREDPGERRY